MSHLINPYIVAPPDSTFGIFAAGAVSAVVTNSVDKYVFSTSSASTSTALSYTASLVAGEASTTVGYVFGGWNSGELTTTGKFTFSNETTAAGGSLDVTRSYAAAAGTNDYSIIFGKGDVSSTSTSKYTYYSDSCASATNMSSSRLSVAGFGSTTTGYFAGGGGTAILYYVYSSDSVNFGNNLTYGAFIYGQAAAGNGVLGVWVSGNYTDSTNKFTFSSGTSTAGTALTQTMDYSTGISNTTKVVFGAFGYNDTDSCEYVLSTDVVSSSATLPTDRGNYAAGCSPASNGKV